LTACVKDIELTENDFTEKLVINSEVNANGNVYVVVSTNVPTNSDLEPIRPKAGDLNAYIVVNGDEENVENLTYGGYYDNDVHAGDNTEVWRCRRLFLPPPGTELEIRMELIGNEMVQPISSKTVVPEATQFADVEFVSEEDNDSELFEYRIQLKLTGDKSTHYHLMSTSGATQLDFSSFVYGSNAIEVPHHHSGVLINGSRLSDDNLINFVIESETELSAADLELRTTTKSYYDYHVSLSRSYASQNSPFNEPTLNYTNVDSGVGLFASYSTVYQTVELK